MFIPRELKIIDHGAIAKGYLPKRKNPEDAGMDCYAPYDLQILPGETVTIPLAFGLVLPINWAGYIRTRSSLSKQGVLCHESPIDPGYTGQCHAILTNCSNEVFHIQEGDRIGQLVFEFAARPSLVVISPEEAERISQGARGAGAFGSTGR